MNVQTHLSISSNIDEMVKCSNKQNTEAKDPVFKIGMDPKMGAL